ncbi:neuromedin-U receptor 1-like [Liolophura sinensis]|uniref:neuromedin-U receptor 1-like n=1 Tax=Liolophura sinensis TaxID=3198878 RepID=UPI00315958D0
MNNSSSYSGFQNLTPEAFLQDRLSKQLWQYLAPIFLIIGLLGNACVFLVLKTMQFQKKSTLLYFFLLALSDTVVLLVGLPYYWILETFEINLRAQSNAGCKILMFLTYFSMHTSSWILVAVSIERFVIIKLPLKSSSIVTVKRSRYSATIIVVLLFFVDGYLIFTQHVQDGSCGSFPDDGFLYYFDENVFVWVDFCLLSAIPAAIMATCNVSITLELRQSVKQQTMLTRSSQQSQPTHHGHISSLTRMLLAANIMFLFTTLPISVYFIVDTFLELKQKDPLVKARMDLAWSIVYLIQYLNYTTNFYIYVARGNRFRQAFWKLIGCSHSELRSASSERGMSGRLRQLHRNSVSSQQTVI